MTVTFIDHGIWDLHLQPHKLGRQYDTIHMIGWSNANLYIHVSYHIIQQKWLHPFYCSITGCNARLPKDCKGAKRGNAAGALARICDPCQCWRCFSTDRLLDFEEFRNRRNRRWKWLILTFLGAKLMRGGWNKSIEDLHMLQGYERDGCESNLNVLSELWAGWEMIWSKVQMTVGNSAWQRCLQSGVKYHAHEKLQLHTSANIITYYHILTCLHKHSRTL